MSTVTTAPYGSWQSEITSELIVARGIAIGGALIDGGSIFWQERRPLEGGRMAIVEYLADGTTVDRLPLPYNARTRVHEYGGGAYTVADGAVYFCNFSDGRIYRQTGVDEPTAITPEGRDWRYADLQFDRRRQRLICVRERHHEDGSEATNDLVAVSVEPAGEVVVLASGADFYASPALSAAGDKLAWLCWDHPNMPWDGCRLYCGKLNAAGEVVDAVQVAGGVDESIFQPSWSPAGELYFVSDRSGWWNIYRQQDGGATNLTPMEAEFGRPQWIFGERTYVFSSPGQIVCTFLRNGSARLATLHLTGNSLLEFELPFTDLAANLSTDGETAVFSAGTPQQPMALVRLRLDTGAWQSLRSTVQLELKPELFSVGEAIEYPSNGRTAHAFFYPPCNPRFNAPESELPPLLVTIHGGPTAATGSALRLYVQYWTSRGFALLDVNYGGSTGYGRAYQRLLQGQWGVVDVEDCLNGARFLAQSGRVDAQRMAITGGSAGGFTTLMALTEGGTFRAGASHYGVADLEGLATNTHKFESRYLDGLIGPYPEQRHLYQERSPLHKVGEIRVPMIFFQGTEDMVVPPAQTESMVAALSAAGVPVAYLSFEGEQHGFRRAENIRRALDAEFLFYSKVFGFSPAEQLEPLNIINSENLP